MILIYPWFMLFSWWSSSCPINQSSFNDQLIINQSPYHHHCCCSCHQRDLQCQYHLHHINSHILLFILTQQRLFNIIIIVESTEHDQSSALDNRLLTVTITATMQLHIHPLRSSRCSYPSGELTYGKLKAWRALQPRTPCDVSHGGGRELINKGRACNRSSLSCY